jgi:excisionase family DNA binding protein
MSTPHEGGLMEVSHMTPRQAAQELGIRLDATYSLIWAGKLEAEKHDGTWRIPTAAVRERLRQRSAAGNPRE